MRLQSLCEALFLLCLCVVPSLAASGQTLSIRRPHQPRKADQIVRTYLHVVTVATLGDVMAACRYREGPDAGRTTLQIENGRRTPDYRTSQATSPPQDEVMSSHIAVQLR